MSDAELGLDGLRVAEACKRALYELGDSISEDKRREIELEMLKGRCMAMYAGAATARDFWPDHPPSANAQLLDLLKSERARL